MSVDTMVHQAFDSWASMERLRAHHLVNRSGSRWRSCWTASFRMAVPLLFLWKVRLAWDQYSAKTPKRIGQAERSLPQHEPA